MPLSSLDDQQPSARRRGQQKGRQRQHAQGAVGQGIGIHGAFLAAKVLHQLHHDFVTRRLHKTDVHDVLFRQAFDEGEQTLFPGRISTQTRQHGKADASACKSSFWRST